jgi:integrase
VTTEDLGRLLNNLNNGRSTRASWKLRAAHWLLASLGTGLRPSEWETAHWLDGTNQSQLYVQNAKWRADQPEVNRFRVVEVDREYQIWVTVHMASIKTAIEEGYTFRQAYDHCRAALRRAAEQLWGRSKQISLYTMRGQFSSNAKAQMPLIDVSALMGHTNPRTTQRNYGKRRYAHAGAVVPRPAQEHQLQQRMAQAEQAHEQEGDEPGGRFASLMRYSA